MANFFHVLPLIGIKGYCRGQWPLSSTPKFDVFHILIGGVHSSGAKNKLNIVGFKGH